jgi:ParB family chromosome partitioning protein
MKQEDISRSVGRSRASVANSIRLLDLAPELQTWLSQERISVGHAKVILSLRSHEEQTAAAEEILRKGLTVRGAETLVAQIADSTGKERRTKSTKGTARVAPAIQRLQNRLQHHFGTHVALQHNDKRGRIEIEYYGQDDLQRILTLLGLESDDR